LAAQKVEFLEYGLALRRMLKRATVRIAMFGLCLIVLAAPLVALAGPHLLPEFSQTRAMADVRSVAALNSRTAGTKGESRAIQYVKEKLRGAPLDVWAEPFFFRSYELNRAVLRIGNVSVQPTRIVFDPYHGVSDIKGDVAFVTAASIDSKNGLGGFDVSQRIVITTRGAEYYRIADLRPQAIVFVSDHEFERLQGTRARRAEIHLKGTIRTMRSANLIAATKNRNAAREILLSAHIDSAGTPGAQDNASGVAVLLELARTLPQLNLPVRLRFVFLGAEEVGLLGSKAYVDRHHDDLQRCELAFNMDSVGGKDIWIDMRDGVQNVPNTKAVRQTSRDDFRIAIDDFKGRWTLINPPTNLPDVSNVPPWLQAAIVDSARELGYQINQGRDAGSDHRTFTEAGIVATDIAIGGIKAHTPEDLADQIIPASLERAARLVTGVVTRSIAAVNTPPASQTIR
jgi:aminopeptidase YwaD